MRILIAGAGGVGGYLAAKLIGAGNEVAILARGAHLAAIRARGLTLRENGAQTTVRPAAAADSGDALGAADLVIFAVKGPDLAGAIATVRPAFGPHTLALPFLNGVEAHEVLAREFGPPRTLIGVARIFAHIAAPGVVVKESPFASFTVGDMEGRQDGERVRAVIDRLRAAGIDSPDCDDVRLDLWRKFVLLTAVAGTTAGARTDIGTVRATPELWALYRGIAEETLALARGRGMALETREVDRAVTAAKAMPGSLRASLAHDLAAGKPLEIDWLNGAVARLARAAGLAAPRNETIAAVLAPWKNGA